MMRRSGIFYISPGLNGDKKRRKFYKIESHKIIDIFRIRRVNMKILENISSGYKRIATGIAIIGFLSMLYLALIPGASVPYVYGPNGGIF
jgi:hypothetical protein